MSEQKIPEKKSNKLLIKTFGCLAIGYVTLALIPDEVKPLFCGGLLTVVAIIGLIPLLKFRKNQQSKIEEAKIAEKRWRRNVQKAKHLANASLDQGILGNYEDEKLFGRAAMEVRANLDELPSELANKIDNLKAD